MYILLINLYIFFRVCFAELGVLLIAVGGPDPGQDQLRINPQDYTIRLNTTGYFIAQSPEEVKQYG